MSWPAGNQSRLTECGHLCLAPADRLVFTNVGSTWGWRIIWWVGRCVVTNVDPTPASDLHDRVRRVVEVGEVGRSRVELFEDIRGDHRREELSIRALADSHRMHRRTVHIHGVEGIDSKNAALDQLQARTPAAASCRTHRPARPRHTRVEGTCGLRARPASR